MGDSFVTGTDATVSPGRVIWITGLSGAGKSTVAQALCDRLLWAGVSVTLLDGDELREVFQPLTARGVGYDMEGRRALALTYARLCQLMARQGQTVIIATISLFEEVHRWNRENLPGYLEVFLDVPLNELERRDPKSIYRSYRSGELTQVAGLDLDVDLPKAPDLHVTEEDYPAVDSIVGAIIRHIEAR